MQLFILQNRDFHHGSIPILEIWLNIKRRHTSGKAPVSHKAYNLLNIFHLDNLQQQWWIAFRQL
jgi:hypothetical protein